MRPNAGCVGQIGFGENEATVLGTLPGLPLLARASVLAGQFFRQQCLWAEPCCMFPSHCFKHDLEAVTLIRQLLARHVSAELLDRTWKVIGGF